MKKIINGRMYDTETAEKIEEWDNGMYGNDFRACEETLYKKKTGEYFIHGSGGALSKYAVSCGNGSTGSSDIIPLTKDRAKTWMEEKGDPDAYTKEFGEVPE